MTKTKTQGSIDPTKLQIIDEPYTEGRAAPPSKYDPIFSRLKVEQRIVCPAGSASKIGGQLKKWLAARGHKDAVVRARERCSDGNGGVWWRAKAATPSSVWQTPDKQAPKLKRAA